MRDTKENINLEKRAFYKTSIGMIEIRYCNDYITYLGFISKFDDLSHSKPNHLSNDAFLQIEEYLAGNRKNFKLPIMLSGTVFQKRVWHELLQIPYGQTASYKYIAKKINSPNAARAVGMACNKNKIAIIIPCHRVIGSNGKLIGYAGGLEIKQKFLEIEKRNLYSSGDQN